jgi:hypothetical protein
MFIIVSAIFMIFLTGTILSGWLLYRLAQVELEPRDWPAQHNPFEQKAI